jgi:hypothetical protein
MKQRLKKMIENGQLIIMNAASISSHDMASSYFQDILSNI